MKESSKCRELRRSRGDFDLWLHGDGIDVGSGSDPLQIDSGTVREWDLPDGDGALLQGVADCSLDFVYNSHCLEHLVDVPTALRNWARVLRPGGRMYVVIPDYLLYEKMTFPSRFNSDHKHTFTEDRRFSRERVGRSNHWVIEEHIAPILSVLGCPLILVRTEADGYDFSRGLDDQTLGPALAQVMFVAIKR